MGQSSPKKAADVSNEFSATAGNKVITAASNKPKQTGSLALFFRKVFTLFYSVYPVYLISFCLANIDLKISTDIGHARVHELGSISIFSIFTITLSSVVHLLRNFVHIVSQTTGTNFTNLVTV